MYMHKACVHSTLMSACTLPMYSIQTVCITVTLHVSLPPSPPTRLLEAVLIIMCTTLAVSIAVMLLGTCVPVAVGDGRMNLDPSSQHLYVQVTCPACPCSLLALEVGMGVFPRV